MLNSNNAVVLSKLTFLQRLPTLCARMSSLVTMEQFLRMDKLVLVRRIQSLELQKTLFRKVSCQELLKTFSHKSLVTQRNSS